MSRFLINNYYSQHADTVAQGTNSEGFHIPCATAPQIVANRYVRCATKTYDRMRLIILILCVLWSACSKRDTPETTKEQTRVSTVAAQKHAVVRVDTLSKETFLYRSRHRFSIEFPSTWILDARFLEEVDTLSWQSGFTFYNYRMDTLSHPGHFETPGIMKIEIHFMKPTHDEPSDIIKERPIIINGMTCRELLLRTEFGSMLSVDYVKDSKYVGFWGYAADSSNYAQFRKIVQSFKFD